MCSPVLSVKVLPNTLSSTGHNTEIRPGINNGHIHGVKTLENYKNDVPKETCRRQLFGVGYLQEVPVSYRVILVLWT